MVFGIDLGDFLRFRAEDSFKACGRNSNWRMKGLGGGVLFAGVHLGRCRGSGGPSFT